MIKDRVETTLFMLQSLDGKITPGDNDTLDVDKDFKRISGVKEGLKQYYDLEKMNDLISINTGRVMDKIGINKRSDQPSKEKISFVIIDSKPYLAESGVEYLSKWLNKLFLVTTNKQHPAFNLKDKLKNLELIYYQEKINLEDLLLKLKNDYKIEKVTIQSGGSLNSSWLREGLIDHVSLVVAPCLIGGANTQSLIGGESLHREQDLKKIRALELKQCKVLKNSYIHLRYDVINNTQIEASSENP